ncbi:SRPBCC domain-containing protein [Streptomyces sp. enrichment culture]|uniref:SRPBCC domain-containing protein n=1 Tax=Streptomyces sp. enrichment culture TaxID=1795815 RepID=UPI003F54CC60
MEHEVFVPVPAERLRDVLADPARVARAVPGLQQDAGAEPVAGRLKVRIGSHSITYRGTLRLSAREDGTYDVQGDATESRGSGTVALALTLRVADADGGSTVTLGGTATADGRVTELPAESVTSATARLLTRFAENLGTAAAEEPRPASVFDTEIPPPSLLATDDETNGGDRGDRGEAQAGGDGEDGEGGVHDVNGGEDRSGDTDTDAAPGSAAPPASGPAAPGPVAPPAEAAHARRTMIGRSAEEVDHAPPRGRYAPVPAPQPSVAGAPLRWAAPAAALVVASAIVVGRALRKRR